MDTGTREEMVDHLADVVEGIEPAHPTRVALDGPPAAGKTTLADEWDLRIFVATTFAKTVDRALIREQHVRPAAEIERRWRERYIPSQQRYFAAVRPTELAHIVVHNNDLELPTWETHTSRLAKDADRSDRG